MIVNQTGKLVRNRTLITVFYFHSQARHTRAFLSCSPAIFILKYFHLGTLIPVILILVPPKRKKA